MGFIDNARGKMKANQAIKAHSAGNDCCDKGMIDLGKTRYETAMKLYEEAYQLGLRTCNFMQSYAILLMREGNIERAKALLLEVQNEKSLTKDDWHNLRINYSICQWRQGNLDKAIETIGHAAREKMNSSVYTTLGMYLVDKARITGDWAEALEFNQKSMDYDDEDAATLDNMGQLYLIIAENSADDPEKVQQYTRKAREYLESAHAHKPRQITTIYYLAEILLNAGETDAARAMVAKADDVYFSALCSISRQDMDALRTRIG